jgi:lysophospholipase L1-like esterase
MSRGLPLLVACAALAVACGASPTAPTVGGGSSPLRIPRLSRTRFVAFGDSLTTGEVTVPVASSGIGKLTVVPTAAYPAVLQSQLQSAYPTQSSDISVSNQGRGGETIFDGVLRFDSVFAASRAEVVLLQEGINGLNVGDVDASTALMRAMVQRARNGGAKVFVGSMLPTISGRQRTQIAPALVAYNTALQSMSTQEGAIYVDLYNGILPQVETLIGIDGLHPTEVGYRKIADLFLAAIKLEIEDR